MKERLDYARRAIEFRLAYHRLRQERKLADLLAAHIGQAIRARSDSFTAVQWMLFRSAGYHPETSPICWEAPLAVLVYLNRAPAFGVGLEVTDAVVSIRQLQGVQGARIPPELRKWPAYCIEGVQTFAKVAGFGQVRVYRAHMDLFYRYPHLPEDMSAEDVSGYVTVVRQRMRRRYDGTARQLTFKVCTDWYAYDVSV